MKLPDIELVSERVHDAWIESKLAVGVTTRKSESGEELMVPYDQLSEQAKELDRMTVRTVYAAIQSTEDDHIQGDVDWDTYRESMFDAWERNQP